jgi:hypothetical protein
MATIGCAKHGRAVVPAAKQTVDWLGLITALVERRWCTAPAVPRRPPARVLGARRRQGYPRRMLWDQPPAPPLSLFALHGLRSLVGSPPFDCRHKGFAFPHEKQRAIAVLRALTHAAHETLDPLRVEEWAAEAGFQRRDARTLGDYAKRVRVERDHRPPFRDETGRPIYRDRDREERMVHPWREELAAGVAGNGGAP